MKRTIKAIVIAIVAGYHIFCDELWKYRDSRTLEERRVFK